MNSNDYIFDQVKDAIKTLDAGSAPLSAVIRMCIRIASLRNDYINLWWLEYETFNILDDDKRIKKHADIFPHFTDEQFKFYFKYYREEWVKERAFVQISEDLDIQRDKNVLAKSVGEIEIELERNQQLATNSYAPQGLHPLDLYFVDKSKTQTRLIAQLIASNCREILDRIRNRINEFLGQTEKQIIYGQIHSDIFEQNRQYVEIRLGQICPEALSKFVTAYRRSTENDPESWAHALTSCRRLLKDLADGLYPPTEKPVIGADGKSRILTDKQFTGRLWQYVFEQTSRSTSSDLLLAGVQDLGNRIDRLYDLTNKGVHAEVSDFEVNQCLIQTYILIGDILRIVDKQSAIGLE